MPGANKQWRPDDTTSLTDRVDALRQRAARGVGPVKLASEMAALVADAAHSVTSDRACDSDLAAGVSLCKGRALDDQRIADRGVVLAIPALLHAVCTGSVHLLAPTQDDVARHASWLCPVAALLGLRVDLLDPADDHPRRLARYRADVVCGTADQFAFDVLRNSLDDDVDHHVPVEQCVAVVDQIDTVLLDHSEQTLWIRARTKVDPGWYQWCEDVASRLYGTYHVLFSDRTATLTVAGIKRVLEQVDVAELYDAHVRVFELVKAAAAVREYYRRGRDYDISGGTVTSDSPLPMEIEDAITVHEGLPLRKATTVLATTSVRRHILRYDLVTGIGVITYVAGDQLFELYDLRTRERDDEFLTEDDIEDDVIFDDDGSRIPAVLSAIRDARARERAVLVSSATVDLASVLAARLDGEPGTTVLRPDDPVPVLRQDSVAIGVGRQASRRGDLRLADAATEARFYLTRSEVDAFADQSGRARLRTVLGDASPVSTRKAAKLVAKLQQEAERAEFKRRQFFRVVNDVIDDQHDLFTELCEPLIGDDEDVLGTVEELLRDRLVGLVRGYRNGHLSYPDLLDSLTALYPCRLPEQPPADPLGAVGADAYRALRERIDDVDSAAGDGSMALLIRRIATNLRATHWRHHLADLDITSGICRAAPPRRRIAEFTDRAEELFSDRWLEFLDETIGYAFHLEVESA